MPSPRRLAIALLVSSPCVALAAPSVIVHPAVGRPTLVTVSGRALRSRPETVRATVPKNVRRLTAKSLEHAPVEVSFAGQVRFATTGEEGEFEVSFPAPTHHPFPLGRQPVRASVAGATGESGVEVISDAAPFMVVSDFDDTIAISNVQHAKGLLESAFLEDEMTQPAVPGMADFYRCLHESSNPPPGFAIVTGSPATYGPRLEAFLGRAGFPFAALHLRRLAPGTLSGYKEPVLRRLLSLFPQPFLLIGDSGEHDPETYSRIREEFPGRIAAVFVRDVGKSADPARFRDMVLFRKAGDAAREAAARGFLSQLCLERAFPAQDAGSK